MKRNILGMLFFLIITGNIYAGGLYSGGSGTAEDPYRITTETDLYNVRNNLSSYFILMNDINLSDGLYHADPGWTPIGPTFRGNFNGNGHIINYLRINRTASNFQGLFAELIGATITKLGLKNAEVHGSTSTGILAAYSQNSTIDQCMTSGIVSSTDANCGGLVGYMDNGTISNSYSVAEVSASGEHGSFAGGLVGVGNGVIITNCYASGRISLSLPPVGGLVANGSSTINNCFWNTDTQGVASSAGGTGISSATMKMQSTFSDAGWSNMIWKLDPLVNSGYPYFLWDNSTPPSDPVVIGASSINQNSFIANWNSSSGATGYYIDVATDNRFTTLVTGFSNKNVGNVTTYSVTGLVASTTYYFRVRAYNAGNQSASSSTLTVVTLPAAPNAPVATPASLIKPSLFNLNWNSVASAEGYFIDVATDNSFTSFVSGYNNKDAGNVITYLISGLNAGTTYYYRVRAYNSGGVSANSNIISVVTSPLPPSALAATFVGNTSFNANWNASAGASGYYLDVATDAAFTSLVFGFSNKDVSNVTSYSVTGLAAGITYYYQVRAYNTGGTSSSSNSNTITVSTVPPVPIAISATSITQTTMIANWNTSLGATGYYLDVATDNRFVNLVPGFNNKNVGNVTTYSVIGLTAQTTYYYRVSAYNTGGASSSSNIIAATTALSAPSAPVATSASLVKQSSFNLNWNTLPGADGYFIDVATDNTFTSFVSGYSNKDAGNVITYSISGLNAGTTYYYRVRAYNSGGVSANSNIISVVTLPLAPSAPVATSVTLVKQSSFNLNWNALPGADGYFIDVATDNAFTSFVSTYSNKDAGNVITYSLSGLNAGTTYYYRVRAYNSGGVSANSNIISVVTLPLAPNAPVATAATLIKQSSFNLNWNALPGVDGYFIDIATDNSFTSFVSAYSNKDAGNVITYSLSGLNAGMNYYYRVRAYNSGGVSINSNIISVVTLPLAPSAPVAMTATLITQTSFNLNWNALAGTDGYFIDIATDNSFTTFVSSYNNRDVSNVTAYALWGLTPGTTYYYRVRAYNSGGVSINSNMISVVTLPLAPNAPVAIAASLIKQTSFSLNWNALTGVSGYFIDVAIDSTFSSFVSGYNNKDAGNVTSLTVSGLTANTKYYYRIRGYNSGGTGVNSNIITVITLQIVSNAPVARPASSVTQISFVANWNLVTGAVGYYIDVAIDNAFNSILTAYNNKDIGNVTSLQVSGLSVGTTYYYRLRAYNTGGTSVNSIIISVTTILTVPDPPVATTGTLIGVNSFTANWNPSPNATGYYIDVAKDLLFTTYVTGYSLRDVGNVLTIPVTGLIAGTTYYFRVVGYNASGIGQYSNVISITLKSATGVTMIAGTPSSFKLNQNYPNPFNPTTKIRFEIPSYSFVRVKIYDAVGKEVKELANEYKSAGIYEMNFVATNLPSGLYLIRMEAGSNGKIYSETRKMILMK